jgi:FkbM family methyltransferase
MVSGELLSMSRTKNPTLQGGWFSFEYGSQTFEFWMREPKDTIQTYIAQKRGFYEENLLEEVRRILPAWPRIVDAGANIGNHALFFARVCRAREVIVFEPNPDVIPELRANLEENSCPNVTVDHLGIGLGSAPGTASLKLDKEDAQKLNRGGTRLEVGAGPVRVEPLDALVFGEVDLIKIDVEGMALEVLEGCERIVRRSRPDVLIEVSLQELPGLHDWLARTGYRVSLTQQDYVGLINMILQPRRVSLGLVDRLHWRRRRGGSAGPVPTALANKSLRSGFVRRGHGG